MAACGGSPLLEVALDHVEDVLSGAQQLLGDGRDTLAAPLCDVLVVSRGVAGQCWASCKEGPCLMTA